MANVPAPKGDPEAPLKALIFDSQYDNYRGVIVFIRVMDGRLRRDMEIKLMGTGAKYKVVELGYLRPTALEPCDELAAGDGGLLYRQHQERGRHPGGRHRHPGGAPGGGGPARLPARPANGLLRHLHRGRLQIPGPAGCPGQAEAQRRIICPTSRRAPWPWASASAAAFWACSTWR